MIERKRSSRPTVDGFEKDLHSILQFFKKKSLPLILSKYSNKELLGEVGVEEQQFFKAFIYILNKSYKTTSEILLISAYLFTLSDFTNFFKKAYDNYDEVIYKIAYQMSYEKLNKDNLMFRTGEKGDKFYIILKGKVAICLPKESIIEMSDIDYIKYLAKLKKHGETEILNRCIGANRYAYPILDDDFDAFLQKSRQMGRNSSHKNSLNKEIVEETIKYLETKDDKQYERISLENYMNLFKPEAKRYSELDEVFRFTIYHYSNVTIVQTGDKFGDIALDNKSQKRTASMITIEETHLGILNKSSYINCVKEANDHVRKSNLLFLFDTQLLRGMERPEMFESKYFNFFVLNKYTRGEYILEENTKSNDYFFIKEGEYEVTMRKSLKELNEIITHLGGSSDSDDNLFTIPDFSKIYHEKMNLKICIIKEKDAIGFEDIIYKGNYICSVQCITAKGEAFSIEKANYDLLLYKEDKKITSNLGKFEKVKQQMLLDKLINLKSIRIQSIKLKYNIKDNVHQYRSHKMTKSETPCIVLNYNDKSIFTPKYKDTQQDWKSKSRESLLGKSQKKYKIIDVSCFSAVKGLSIDNTNLKGPSLLKNPDFNYFMKRLDFEDRKVINTSILLHPDEINYKLTTNSVDDITKEYKLNTDRKHRKKDKEIIKEAKEKLLVNKLRNTVKESSNIIKYNLFKPKYKVLNVIISTKTGINKTIAKDDNSITNITLNERMLTENNIITKNTNDKDLFRVTSIEESKNLYNLKAKYIFKLDNKDDTKVIQKRVTNSSLPQLDLDNNMELELRRANKTTKFLENFLLKSIQHRLKKNKLK
jgi:CRP-like cAMP-binding protein